MGDLSFPQGGSDITATASSPPRGHNVPDDGSLTITWDAGPPRLVLAGDIDLKSHAALIAALASAADGTRQVQIDMAGVRFCDMAGLRILVHGGDGQQPAPVQATLHNLPPHLDKLLHLVNRQPAPDLAAGAAGPAVTSPRHPGQEMPPVPAPALPGNRRGARSHSSAPAPDASFPVEIIQGVPVVAAPAEIDITNAEALRSALLRAAAKGHGTLVVDMTQTRFCDSSGLHTLIAAHKRARAEGDEMRLVIPGPPVLRVLAITGMDRVFPSFTTLAQALAQPAATANGRSRQRN